MSSGQKKWAEDGYPITQSESAMILIDRNELAALRQQVKTLNAALDAKIDICGDKRITELRQKLEAAEKDALHLKTVLADIVEAQRLRDYQMMNVYIAEYRDSVRDAIAAGRK